MGWYEDVLEELDGLFPGEGGPPEWNKRDCDALPVEQMMRCATMHREYVDIEGRWIWNVNGQEIFAAVPGRGWNEEDYGYLKMAFAEMMCIDFYDNNWPAYS